MKRQFALGAAVALLGASLAACADPTVQRPATVGTATGDRTSPGDAPGADPSGVMGATDADEGQQGQQ